MTTQPRVADLAHEPILQGVWVLAGSAGMERVVHDVRWHADGVEEIRGQLVICGEAHVSPPYRLDALVRRCQDAGAAALLVVAGPFRPLMSSVRLADRLEIPVLWLENDDPIGLLQELTARVREPEQVRSRTIERLLRQLSTKRDGQEILTAAEHVLAAPLSLITAGGVGILGDPVTLEPGLRLTHPVPQQGERLLVHPVLDLEINRAAAWLACRYERAADARLELLAAGLAMVEPFVRAWITGQRARIDRDAAFQTHLLAQILAGGDAVSRDVVEGAVSLGWRLQDWHVGVHLVAETADGPGGQAVRDQLTEAFADQGVRVVTAVDRGDGWALWVSSEVEPGANEGRALLRAVRLVAARLPREWGVVAGIGRAHRGPSGLAATLGEARDAADLARSHDVRPSVEHTDELGVARLLATWQRSDVTRAFAESALLPLRDPAQSYLLTTLRAYLESGGSVVETAHTLGVHRNTVTTRIQQVRDRLGVDLDDPSQRLALQVACRVLAV